MKILRNIHERLLRYAFKFGIVGLIGYVVDVLIFNTLRLGVTGVHADPLAAKFVSVAVSTIVTWFGNRYWTFREHRRKNFILELVEFTAIAVAGLGISLLCLWISHYLLGLRSLFADNVSANVIGLVLATIFRFVMYRYWVYGHHRRDGLTARIRREAEAFPSPAGDASASARPTGTDRRR